VSTAISALIDGRGWWVLTIEADRTAHGSAAAGDQGNARHVITGHRHRHGDEFRRQAHGGTGGGDGLEVHGLVPKGRRAARRDCVTAQ
jgi:hypothetical protein